jgi:CDP-diglyceride synthetase
MTFLKAPVLRSWRIPIDGGRCLRDGKRIFGDNKTWKGFVGMTVFTPLSLIAFCLLGRSWAGLRALLPIDENVLHSIPLALAYGTLLGFAYVAFELPNSLIKRRLDIAPGTNAVGVRGLLFLIIDQLDSVFGCMLVVPAFTNLNSKDCMLLVVIGGLVHYATNLLLYVVGLKRQAG